MDILLKYFLSGSSLTLSIITADERCTISAAPYVLRPFGVRRTKDGILGMPHNAPLIDSE